MKVKMKNGVIEILLFFTIYSYFCECRSSQWHRRFLDHDTHTKHQSRINRSFRDIGEDTSLFNDVINAWRVHVINPMVSNAKSTKHAAVTKKHYKKRDKDRSIVENISAHSHTIVSPQPQATESHHLTSGSGTKTIATTHTRQIRHANKPKIGSTTSAHTTKPTKKVSVDLKIHAATSSSNNIEHSNQEIHKQINNLRLKIAVSNIESDLKKLKDVIRDQEIAQQTTTVRPTTLFTGRTTIGVQTTPKPFPGEYQGYIPVTKAVPSTLAPSPYNADTGKHNRATRRVKNGHSHEKVHLRHKRIHHPFGKTHFGKKKRLGELNKVYLHVTPNTVNKNGSVAELHHHISIARRLNSINKNIVSGMLGVRQRLKRLDIHIKQALHEIGNDAADNTNEERTDIKVNSDRIAQLQQGLEKRIDDIRYNITRLITSQKEVAKSMTWSLEKMVLMLSHMVDKVTASESKLPAVHQSVTIVAKPESTTGPTLADTKEHVT